jgi:hypothetical protein
MPRVPGRGVHRPGRWHRKRPLRADPPDWVWQRLVPAMSVCHLTTPHRLQGRGSVGKASPAAGGVLLARETDGRALSA